MVKGILHTHMLVVIIFLLLLLIKTVLLLLNNHALLDKIRAKTKVAEMILGTLILATGGYLLFATGNTDSYMIGKIIIVLLAIPLGIVGLKKKNKALALLSLLAFIYVYGVAETKSLKFKRDKFVLPEKTPESAGGEVEDENSGEILNRNEEALLSNAKQIYMALCVQCHGEDGRLGTGGARDLTQTTLTLEEREEVIGRGRGLMRGFKSELTEQEIRGLALYIETLK